jgi:hypothetical protein
MKLKLTNNAETTLAGAINETATTILLRAGSGQFFPALGAGEFFPMTLVKTSGGAPAREIVYVTARNVDSCTVLRAQENTAATSFSTGDYAGCHLTAGCIAKKADLDGATFTGSVDMGDNQITQAILRDCALAYKGDATNTIDIRNGSAQRWAPAAGAQTLTITGWPPTGSHGELMLYLVNGGASVITIDGSPVNFVNNDGTFSRSNSLNSNHGAALQSSGIDMIMFWSPDGGLTRYCKVVR